jgi:translation elongation factor P/translation initiation factor 5A
MTYIQLDLRDIGSGAFVPTRFRMTEDLELAPLDDPEAFSFLYTADSGNTFIFMQQHTFEQVCPVCALECLALYCLPNSLLLLCWCRLK